MRKGKISEKILGRSVIKTIKYRNPEYIITGASRGCDASVTAFREVISQADAGLMFDCEKMWFDSEIFQLDVKRAFYNAINNVAADCGEPRAVQVSLLLPKKTQEEDIRGLMGMISSLCQQEHVEIAGGDTEVSDHVLSPIVHFTAYGPYLPETVEDSRNLVKEGMDIVQAGEIGLSGTAAIVCLKREELAERFTASYLDLAAKTGEAMNSVPASLAACRYGVRVMHDLSRGGIQAGLWELAEKTGMGLEADLEDILVRQETIEMCERYILNPYKMLSNGSVLLVTGDGNGLCEFFKRQGIRAAVIGKLMNSNDKVLIKGEEKRYLEPPRGDELDQL